jgi:hypothetical protein
MAMGTSVPPRAYTRETLTTAFNWLQSQPESVRSKATTPDALVGLFMQAQRGGTFANGFDAEAPQSSQAFMSDLKNLAEGLKEFDDSRHPRAVPPPASSRAQLGQQQTYPHAESRPAAASPVFSQTTPTAPVYEPAVPQATAGVAAASGSYAAGAAAAASSLTGELNERSLEMLREVQLALNLSSEAETMNMMIALAHKSLKSLLA